MQVDPRRAVRVLRSLQFPARLDLHADSRRQHAIQCTHSGNGPSMSYFHLNFVLPALCMCLCMLGGWVWYAGELFFGPRAGLDY